MSSKIWRLRVFQTASNVAPSICELEMFSNEEPGINLCVGGEATASSSLNSTRDAIHAFDGIKTGDTGWVAASDDTNAWLQYEFANMVDVASIEITNRAASGTSTTPTGFVVEYLDSNLMWIPRFHHTTTSWPTTALSRTFEANVTWDGTGKFTRYPLFNHGEPDYYMGDGTFIIPYQYTNFKGDGYISGVVKERGVPIQGVVSLVHPGSQQIIKRMKTNSLGEYKFSGIRVDFEYDVIAQDAAALWEKRVSSRRVPIKEG